MSAIDFILMILIAAGLGALAQRVLGLQRGGWLLTTFLGFLGVLLGRFLAWQLQFHEPLPVRIAQTSFPLVWSVVGGLVTTVLAAFLTRKWRRGDRKKK